MPPKRRRRFQGLYYHSSPPKVLPMNGQLPNDGGRRRRDTDDFSVKLSTIRIWMHEKDIGKLTRILWAGQGNRLRQQASTNSKVKRFLTAVPYVMNSIRDVHQAVIDNSLETLQANLEPPVPPALVTCRDANGLNLIHKAAGLGHATILEYLITTWPDGVHECDITGKTPLHWAASAKNNMRCYTLLTQAGCDEEAVDYKMKTPSFYRHKPHEIERAFLTYVPEAPRVSPDVATDWEALSDDSGDGKKLDIRIPEMNGFGRHSNAESNENTSEAEMTEGASAADDDEAVGGGGETEAEPEPETEPEAETENDHAQDEPEDTPAPEDEPEKEDETAKEEEPKDDAKDQEEEPAHDDEEDKNEEAEDEPQDEKQTQSVSESDTKAPKDEEEDKKDESKPDASPENTAKEALTNEESNDKTADKSEESKAEQLEESNENKEEKEKEDGSEAENKEEEIVKEAETENKQDQIVKENEIENKDTGKDQGHAEQDKSESNEGNQETKAAETVDKDKDEKEENVKETPEKLIEEKNDNSEEKGHEEEKTSDNKDDKTEKAQQDQNAEINGKLQVDDKNENDTEKEQATKDIQKEEDEKLAEEDKHKEKDDKGDAEANNDNESESQDVVVHTSSANTSAKGPKVNGVKHAAHGNGESSDDTNEDEDEESEAEAAGDENVDEEQRDDEERDNEADKAADNAEEQEADNQPPVDESDNDAETGNDADKSVGSGAEDSHTSSLAIEGFVQGESEDNTVQSQTAAYVDEDDEESRISRIIKSGDMEQLAQIVLNGDGQKLLDVEATEPEIQAFLRNVPNYMEKIRRVHEAARGGSLLNLQQALDRRKFAVAKDEISPDGATPLHVAVLFGHSDIVRYLAARFPETTTITDNDDRTALHYAAVVNDNGHFYNVLLQLGANPKALDKMGIAPEQYLGNDDLRKDFNYGQLLKKFGAEELEAELLSDQGQIENPSFQANPIFKTEQGKYLADNLADPLIKALTQVAHKRPQDPLQYLTNYLQNFVSTRNTNGKTLVQAAVHSGSSHTNSTALVTSNPSPQRQFQNSQMNGHVTYDNSDDIEDDTLPDDDGNDSDAALSKKLEERDEHGQSMLHFASARSHRRGGLLHLIEESKADITYRDELYRTARDVALQANQVGNAKEIDRYLISLAIVGDVRPFEHFALSGYDHIIDVMDDNEVPIVDVVEAKGHTELATYLKGVRPMEELREELHQMIRDNRVERVKEIVGTEDGKMLIMAKNYYGRTALHIAILKELEDIVEHFVNICPEALKIGDNLERTPLHYAMGTNLVEGVSRVLIQNGAKRTNKDLKGRQPSYYFMNKADILRLQEEEDENR